MYRQEEEGREIKELVGGGEEGHSVGQRGKANRYGSILNEFIS